MIDRDPLLFGIKRVKELKDHSATLDAHTNNHMIHSMQKGIKEERLQILYLMGFPGSGKTTIEENIRRRLGSKVARIGFDEDGRNIARERGIIGKRKQEDESTEEYFEKMSSPLVPRMIEIISGGNVSTILINSPVITRLKINGEYRGVNLGSDLLHILRDPDLLWNKFGIDSKDLPDVDQHGIVLVAGREQRVNTAISRYMVKEAKSSYELRTVFARLGIDVTDKTDEELFVLQSDGARVSTMDQLRPIIDKLVYGEEGKPLRRNLPRSVTEFMISSNLPSSRFGYLPGSTQFGAQLNKGLEELNANSLRDMYAEILLANSIRRSFGDKRKNIFIGTPMVQRVTLRSLRSSE